MFANKTAEPSGEEHDQTVFKIQSKVYILKTVIRHKEDESESKNEPEKEKEKEKEQTVKKSNETNDGNSEKEEKKIRRSRIGRIANQQNSMWQKDKRKNDFESRENSTFGH